METPGFDPFESWQPQQELAISGRGFIPTALVVYSAVCTLVMTIALFFAITWSISGYMVVRSEQIGPDASLLVVMFGHNAK
jgi:hypothetical protein